MTDAERSEGLLVWVLHILYAEPQKVAVACGEVRDWDGVREQGITQDPSTHYILREWPGLDLGFARAQEDVRTRHPYTALCPKCARLAGIKP